MYIKVTIFPGDADHNHISKITFYNKRNDHQLSILPGKIALLSYYKYSLGSVILPVRAEAATVKGEAR